jgi:hypothetical protein
LASVLTDLEARSGRRLPADFEARYRARVEVLFDTRLRPIVGAAEMLDASMGFAPDRCVVVEDSEVGLQAAAAAGIYALQVGSERGASRFVEMSRLPALLERIARSIRERHAHATSADVALNETRTVCR